ncbi:MAG: polysaccharide deacetylase family protein [Phycisphaerales bacterium]
MRHMLDAAAWRLGGVSRGLESMRRSLTVLAYHRVLPAAEAAAYPLANLVVTREAFEGQVAWLTRHAEVVTVREGLERLGRRERPARPMVALTFDDGYSDSAAHAAPVLEAAGVRGTFYVATGFVDGTPMWFDAAAGWWMRRREAGGSMGRSGGETVGDLDAEILFHAATLDSWLGWLKSLPPAERDAALAGVGAGAPPANCAAMSREQVRTLAEQGHEIGSHTVTHPILTRLAPDALSRELVDSRATLEAWTGSPVAGFCYPNGSWSPEVRRACIDAGYAYAASTERGRHAAGDDAWSIRRRWIAMPSTTRGGAHRDAAFACEVVGLHDLMRRAARRRGRARKPEPPAATVAASPVAEGRNPLAAEAVHA